MVEIVAIVRRKKASATKEELARIGCQGYSVFPVLGRGKQRGLRGAQGHEDLVPPPAGQPQAEVPVSDAVAPATTGTVCLGQTPAGGGMTFLPKALFDLLVGEEHAQETIEALIRATQTGEFGDGKLFVIEVGESYRISTDMLLRNTSSTDRATSGG